MNIELSDKEFRLLLDMVYIGNWILNSARGDDRIDEYDRLESKIFAQCARDKKLHSLFSIYGDDVLPSRAFENGGIHEAIVAYEDSVFFEILAEELARKDMDFAPVTAENYPELAVRIEEYIAEFEENGVENVTVENNMGRQE